MSFPTIVKADKTVETFDPERLVSSLRRAGAGAHAAERIAERIETTLTPGTSSKDLYSRAFALLRKEGGRPVAARYALRRALFEFGPSGHPFEDFISHLFVAEGWNVETRKMIKGHCVTHEVDFYASRKDGSEHLAAELKYHNDPGFKSDLKIALYVKSRFADIFACDPAVRACPLDRGLLVTNTKFTSEAIAYAECAGVELLGWSYPVHENLFTRMSRARVYPVTTLTTLTATEKRLLVQERIVAVDMLLADRSLLGELHFSPEKTGQVLAEAQELLALEHPQVHASHTYNHGTV
jgi:hypothetical protein